MQRSSTNSMFRYRSLQRVTPNLVWILRLPAFYASGACETKGFG